MRETLVHYSSRDLNALLLFVANWSSGVGLMLILLDLRSAPGISEFYFPERGLTPSESMSTKNVTYLRTARQNCNDKSYAKDAALL